jgi:hypothetical protein
MESVHAGEHHIQHDRVEWQCLGLLQALDSIRGDIHRVTLPHQPTAEQFGHFGIVLDN